MSSSLPLQNQRIVVTRSAEQADSLCDKLEALGAIPIRFPVIQFDPLAAPELDDALSQLEQYAWLLFTSGNAVRFFLERLEISGLRPRDWRLSDLRFTRHFPLSPHHFLGELG